MKRVDGPLLRRRAREAGGVRSLAWSREALTDWVGGGAVHLLDGSRGGRRRHDASRFDAVVVAPDGRHAVIHEKLGTKGLILDRGERVVHFDPATALHRQAELDALRGVAGAIDASRAEPFSACWQTVADVERAHGPVAGAG